MPSSRFAAEVERLTAVLRGKPPATIARAMRKNLDALPVAALAADNALRYVAVNGRAEELTDTLRDRVQEGWDLATAVRTAVQALSTMPEQRQIPNDQIEAGVLDRTRPQRRKFRRLADDQLAGILSG